MHTNRLIRRAEVRHLTGLSDSSLDRAMREGRFPLPVKLSTNPKCRAVGWSEREVLSWISERLRSSNEVA